jgi:hypothetical protein
MEDLLGRVIKTESAQKDRTRLSKSIVLALRELMKQAEPDSTSQDLAAYISLALLTINDGIESSVNAWEKRGYWVKADRFRRDWEWSKAVGDQIGRAVLDENWGQVAEGSVKIAQKFSKITIAAKHRLGTPWVGAYEQLKKKSKV